MKLTDDMIQLLKKLRLSGILETLDARLLEATDTNLSHKEFLFRLLRDEVERRDGKQLDQRLRRACFEQVRTVEDFDFAFNPSIPRAKVLELANVGFVARRENVLLVGNAGVGKSHLAQAFGHRACRAGYSVLYVGANEMFRQLRASRADDTYDRKLARLTAPDLLVIDDLGLRTLADHEPDDLFEIIRLRYERGAIVITSNRDEREIARLFGDPLLASAAMDRLLHHAHVLDLEGESYRNPPPERRRQRARANQEAAQ